MTLELIWFDDDVIEIEMACCNGVFSGRTQFYMSYDALSDFANTIRGFPASPGDTRQVKLGTLNSTNSEGEARLDFRCLNFAGRSVVGVKLRANSSNELGEYESVSLLIPVEAIAIDAFVQDLTRMKTTIGAGARLIMAQW